jgi:hypothetical protein
MKIYKMKKKAKFCSPSNDSKKTSCYNKKTLIDIANIINNNSHLSKKNQENLKGGTTIVKIKTKNKSKNEIWGQISKQMGSDCQNEWCWIKNKVIKNNLSNDVIDNTFRPEKPEKWYLNKHTWLTTTDIAKVMKQYENKYVDFVFFGPVPVDCPNGINCELTNLNIENMYNTGIRKIGIVFNLDKHNQSGSHWVAMFVKLDKKQCNIIYYDSYGEKPPNEINDFMIEICKKIRNIGKYNIDIQYNKKRNQFGHSECGVFSMIFIIASLVGFSLNDISTSKKMVDMTMTQFRDYLYRPI